jgi:hypothetical protein
MLVGHASILLLLACVLAVTRSANVARTNLIESVTTYKQCLQTDPALNSSTGIACNTPDDGMVSLVLSLVPETGGGTQYEFDTTDPVVLGSLAPGTAVQRARVTVLMARAGLAYQLQLIRYVPAAYFPQVTSNGSPINGLTIAGAALFVMPLPPQIVVGTLLLLAGTLKHTCPTFNGLVRSCNGRAEVVANCYNASQFFTDPRTELPGIAFVNETVMFRGLGARGFGNCSNTWCGVCYSPQGMSRTECNRERFFWVYPIFNVYRLFPSPIVNTTITVTVQNLDTNSSSSSTQPETLTLGVSLNQAVIPNSQPLPLSVFSQNRRVRATLLGVQSLSPLPIQVGYIFAAQKHPLTKLNQIQPGVYDYECTTSVNQFAQPIENTYCPPYDAFEEGPTNPRCPDPNDASTCTGKPPYFWGWGIYGRNGLFIGPGCNEYGITPDYYGRQNGRNSQAVCRNGLFACIPGFDAGTDPSRFARSPLELIQENFDFCGWDGSTCSRSPQTPPNMPQALGSISGQSRVWLSQNYMMHIPYANLGIATRVQILVSGSFLGQRVVAGRGFLAQPRTGAGCRLVFGGSGSMFATVCSTTELLKGRARLPGRCRPSVEDGAAGRVRVRRAAAHRPGRRAAGARRVARLPAGAVQCRRCADIDAGSELHRGAARVPQAGGRCDGRRRRSQRRNRSRLPVDGVDVLVVPPDDALVAELPRRAAGVFAARTARHWRHRHHLLRCH